MITLTTKNKAILAKNPAKIVDYELNFIFIVQTLDYSSLFDWLQEPLRVIFIT
jgi:hypothetical protein